MPFSSPQNISDVGREFGNGCFSVSSFFAFALITLNTVINVVSNINSDNNSNDSNNNNNNNNNNNANMNTNTGKRRRRSLAEELYQQALDNNNTKNFLYSECEKFLTEEW